MVKHSDIKCSVGTLKKKEWRKYQDHQILDCNKAAKSSITTDSTGYLASDIVPGCCIKIKDQEHVLINPPLCDQCEGDHELTVKHILIECNFLKIIRRRHYDVTDLNQLFKTVSSKRILDFVKDMGLYNSL